METKIATNIETSIFYSIVEYLKSNAWNLDIEYDEKIFDKGIDFDFYLFSKDNQIIMFAWNNWFEGEIKATLKLLIEISAFFNFKLIFDEPEYLHKPNFIIQMKDLLKFSKKE